MGAGGEEPEVAGGEEDEGGCHCEGYPGGERLGGEGEGGWGGRSGKFVSYVGRCYNDFVVASLQPLPSLTRVLPNFINGSAPKLHVLKFISVIHSLPHPPNSVSTIYLIVNS